MRKRCRKLLSFVLTMAMVLSMAAMTAFAAGEAAETGGTQYATLQEAINHANGGTVRLLRDVEESVTVAEGVSVTLDLGGFTLTGKADHTIVNRGVLTVTGNGTVVNNLGGKAALYTAPTGKSVLSGGTFTGNSWYVIKNLGEMEIDGASVKQEHTGSSGIANGYYGNLATDCNETYPSSAVVKLTIKKGTFNGGMNTVKNDDFGVLVIEGGSFSNTAGPTILNWHEATINGGLLPEAMTEPVFYSVMVKAPSGEGNLPLQEETLLEIRVSVPSILICRKSAAAAIARSLLTI